MIPTIAEPFPGMDMAHKKCARRPWHFLPLAFRKKSGSIERKIAI